MSEQIEADKSAAAARILGPLGAYSLVLLGMAPFFAGAIGLWRYSWRWGGEGDPLRFQLFGVVLLGYGAVILSFLGGVRWGVELANRPDHPRTQVLVLSVLGALFGWVLVVQGVMVRASPGVFAAFALAFLLHLTWDAQSADLPKWFKRLRFIASSAAAISFLAAASLLT
ncbi:MAG: DUF3429 domain-containing protein [Pseudomonadota bacterium]